jgi:hypothetical protein
MQSYDAQLALKTFLAVDPASRRDWFRGLQDLSLLLWKLRLNMPLATFQEHDQLGEIVIDNPPQNMFRADAGGDTMRRWLGGFFISSGSRRGWVCRSWLSVC